MLLLQKKSFITGCKINSSDSSLTSQIQHLSVTFGVISSQKKPAGQTKNHYKSNFAVDMNSLELNSETH